MRLGKVKTKKNAAKAIRAEVSIAALAPSLKA
jgi:hypothetical protein